MALAQRLLERRVQLLGRDLALLEVERHQLLVDLDHLVDQRAVRGGDRREIGFAGGIEKAVDDALAAVGRQVDRQALLAERRLDRREQRRQVDVLGVDLVDDRRGGRACACAAHSIIRDVIISMPAAALMTTAAVSTASSAPIAWPMKSGKPGRVDQVDARVLRLEVQHRRAQRMLPGLFERIEIADRRAALDAAGRLDRAGLEQQRLGQRGLARRRRARPAPPCGCSRWRISPCMSSPPGNCDGVSCRTAILPCRAGAALAAGRGVFQLRRPRLRSNAACAWKRRGASSTRPR